MTCKTCRFCAALDPVKLPKELQCRRYPATPLLLMAENPRRVQEPGAPSHVPSVQSFYPPTRGENWCGEYAPFPVVQS